MLVDWSDEQDTVNATTTIAARPAAQRGPQIIISALLERGRATLTHRARPLKLPGRRFSALASGGHTKGASRQRKECSDGGTQADRCCQSASEWERLFDLSLDLFCIAGFDGYFKRVNLAFERTLGYSQRGAAGPAVPGHHPPGRPGVVRRARSRISQRGEDVVGFVNRVICADGSVRWLEWNTLAVPDEGLRVRGCQRRDRPPARGGRTAEAQRLVEASRDEFRLLAEEQAALRRVATLVARRVPPNDVFAVVAEEVARVVHVRS